MLFYSKLWQNKKTECFPKVWMKMFITEKAQSPVCSWALLKAYNNRIFSDWVNSPLCFTSLLTTYKKFEKKFSKAKTNHKWKSKSAIISSLWNLKPQPWTFIISWVLKLTLRGIWDGPNNVNFWWILIWEGKDGRPTSSSPFECKL